jgi:hypothetical protein
MPIYTNRYNTLNTYYTNNMNKNEGFFKKYNISNNNSNKSNSNYKNKSNSNKNNNNDININININNNKMLTE